MMPDTNVDDDPGSALDLSLGDEASEASTAQEDHDTGGDGRAGASDSTEVEAREMGWCPEAEWKGSKGKWLDAKTFVDRGNQILPILRANNLKMKEELLTRDKDLATLKESLGIAQKAIATLRKGYNESTKREVELALSDLRDQFKAAREVGDVDLELKVKKNLDDLTAKAEKIGTDEGDDDPITKKPEDTTTELHPDFIKWKEDNQWFGNMVNKDDGERTKAMTEIAKQLRKDGNTVVGLHFMQKCMEILEEKEKGFSRPRSKVETGGGSRTGGGGRAFDSLPKEAKQICHDDNDSFVGAGKMFKTVKEWEDHYAKLYQEG